MAAIILPSRRVVRPADGYALNEARVREHGAIYLGLPGQFIRDPIRGLSLLNPGSLSSSASGRVLRFNGAQQGRAAIALPSVTGLIVAARVRALAAPAAVPGAAFGLYAGTSVQSGFGVGYNASGLGVGFSCLTSNGAYSNAVSAVPIGDWATVYVQLASSGSNVPQVAYINGKPATFGQGEVVYGAAGAGLDQVVFGSQYRSAGFLRQFNGEIEWASILHVPFDGAIGFSLTDDLAARLYEENYPYNLIQPTQRRVIVDMGATNYNLTAVVGAYSLTGIDATLAYVPGGGAFTLTADTGIYSLTGNDAGLTFARRMTADVGSYTLNGVDAGLLVGRRLTADTGAYSLAGVDAALIYTALGPTAYALTAETGSYVLSGNAAGLTYTDGGVLIDTHDGFWAKEWARIRAREKRKYQEEIQERVEEIQDEIAEVEQQIVEVKQAPKPKKATPARDFYAEQARIVEHLIARRNQLIDEEDEELFLLL